MVLDVGGHDPFQRTIPEFWSYWRRSWRPVRKLYNL